MWFSADNVVTAAKLIDDIRESGFRESWLAWGGALEIGRCSKTGGASEDSESDNVLHSGQVE